LPRVPKTAFWRTGESGETMKKLAVAIAMTLIVAAAAFSEDGANGWDWSKHADPMNDQTQFIFTKTTVDDEAPLIILIYQPAGNDWYWGIFRHDPWTKDQFFHVAFRFGKEPASEGSFLAEQGRLIRTIDDLSKFQDDQDGWDQVDRRSNKHFLKNGDVEDVLPPIPGCVRVG
jgi:hypothetical protein